MPTEQPELAYLVPFRVDVDDGRVTITNASTEHLRWVRLALMGPGVMTPVSPGDLEAGRSLVVHVNRATAIATRLQLTWIRADGSGPYVWASGL